MGKKLLITEKPSVAMEFAKALKITTNRKNGYLESEKWIITWCVGHLVTMSYPEKYDEKLKFWRLDTLPFIPSDWKYEIIPQVENQFNIVKGLMQREDIEEIYNAGDSGREGEYIQRLVFMMAHPNPNAKMKRVWIDSQTEEEILNQDFKIFHAGDVSFGVAQISAMGRTELDKVQERIEPKLEQMMGEKQIQMIFVMLTDILNESTYLIYRGADASQLVAAAYNCEPSDQGIMLENVVSRKKQLIPALINTLAERKM